MSRQTRTADIDLIFWQQWQKHQNYLYRCCINWMGDNLTEAEDALSQAMLKAREQLLKISEPIKNFKAWFAKLTYNLCMDLQRKRSRGAVAVANVGETAPHEDWFGQQETPVGAA